MRFIFYKKLFVKKKVKNGKKIQLKKGKKAAITSAAVPEYKTVKVKKHRVICYESTDNNVAYVKNNKIIVKGKGKCKLFIYAQNGISIYVNLQIK